MALSCYFFLFCLEDVNQTMSVTQGDNRQASQKKQQHNNNNNFKMPSKK